LNHWSPADTQSQAPAIPATLANFKASLRKIAQVNANPASPFWLSLNKFSGMSAAQFENTILMKPKVKITGPRPGVPTFTAGRRLLQSPPAKINWKTAGRTSPIRDQGAVSETVSTASAIVFSPLLCLKNQFYMEGGTDNDNNNK
jgi:hypothetical protein